MVDKIIKKSTPSAIVYQPVEKNGIQIVKKDKLLFENRDGNI